MRSLRCDNLDMITVTSTTAIESVAELARQIWTQHFVPIIGESQVEYMLASIQSPAAITQQIAQGYEYFLVMEQGAPIGYCAIVHDPKTAATQLSKIYVLPEEQGSGRGTHILSFVETHCREQGAKRLWLTVNRHNAAAIGFYQSRGFEITDTMVQSIGEGFVMDDYIMSKTI